MSRDRNIPVEIRNTQAGPELDTGRAGHRRLSANDKVLYFSSTFYSFALPFTIQEDQGSLMGPGGPQRVLRGGWAAHLTGTSRTWDLAGAVQSPGGSGPKRSLGSFHEHVSTAVRLPPSPPQPAAQGPGSTVN